MELIAHRGVPARAPENTLASFVLALDAGAAAIETDVRMTADGRLVLMHDDHVGRTTGAEGCVSRMTVEQVRSLDAAALRAWPERAQVPTLEELLDLVAGRAHLYLEVKGAFCEGVYTSAAPVASALLDVIDGVERVTVSSFDPSAVAVVRERVPHRRTALGALPGYDVDAVLAVAMGAGHAEVHPPFEAVDASFIERAHAAGIEVRAWTVNGADDLRRMRAIGIDGVFTDDVEAARAALG